ncbi:MAG: Gfo/Idh/MocA family oxidoreductase [Clostridia bacterium]|nr:Gfo/Idh/MocA family oxidoreductase [Clostridia bacterium]
MDKVRFGIIGLGNMGSTYLGMFENGMIKDGVVSAICDINPEKLKAAEAKISREGVLSFIKYEDMLSSGAVDAIMIETPHYIHPEIAIAALERGIHALCDKPAGVYTKQVREMNEVSERSDAVFGMMFNQRTNVAYAKMREMIAEGAIGSLQRVSWIITDWFRTQYYYDSGNWRATWAGEGGGVLINQCPHQIDLISWIVGEQPKAVRGFCKYGAWHDVEVEDEVTAYFEYENGATGTFITTTGEAPGTNRLEISGTGGKLLAEDGKLTYYKNLTDSAEHSRCSTEGFKKPKCEICEVECPGESTGHAGIINNFIGKILGLEELLAPGTSGINGVDLMNAIELSGWQDGKRVTLPTDEELYLELLNEKRKTSRLKCGIERAAASTEGSY